MSENVNIEVEELQRNLAELSQTISDAEFEQRNLLAIQKQGKTLSVAQLTELDRLNKLIRDEGEKRREATKQLEEATKAQKEYNKTVKTVDKTFGFLGGTTNTLIDAILDTSKDLTRLKPIITGLGGGIKNSIDLALENNKITGLTAVSLKALTAGFVGLTSRVIDHSNLLLGSTRTLKEVGANVSLSSAAISEFARDAKFSGQSLNDFNRIAVGLGSTLIALGGSTSKGVEAFSKFINVGDDQLKKYDRLGVSQVELTEYMADFADRMARSGFTITRTADGMKALQNAALEYKDTLITLQTITGASVKQQEDAAKRANAYTQYVLYKTSLGVESRQLREEAERVKDQDPQRAAELTAEADRLLKRLTSIEAAVTGAAPEITEGPLYESFIQMMISGQPTSEQMATLTRMFPGISELSTQYNQGDMEPEEFAAKFQAGLVEGVGEMVSRVSHLAMVAGPDVETIINTMLGGTGILKLYNRLNDISSGEMQAVVGESSANIAKALAGTEKTYRDIEGTTQKFATTLDNFNSTVTNVVRNLQSLYQGAFTNMINPLTSGNPVASSIVSGLTIGAGFYAATRMIPAAGGLMARVLRRGASAATTAGATAATAAGATAATTAGATAATAAGATAATTAGATAATRAAPSAKASKFARLIQIVRAHPKLGMKIAGKLALSAGLMLVPGPGWVMALLNLGINISSAWLIYQIWRDLNNENDNETQTDEETIGSFNNITAATSELSASLSQLTDRENLSSFPSLTNSLGDLKLAVDLLKDSFNELNNISSSGSITRGAPRFAPQQNAPADIQSYLAKMIHAESGGRNIGNIGGTSSAFGVGQMTRGTFQDLVDRSASDSQLYGRTFEEFKVNIDLQMAALNQLTENNKKMLEDAEIAVTDSALYMAHFLGASGAIKVLKSDPDTDLTEVVSQRAINANRGVFGQLSTVNDLMNWSDHKMRSSDQIASLASGGIATGSTQGYPAMLHGTELVQPIDANSILAKLATTPEGTQNNLLGNTENTITILDSQNKEIMRSNMKLVELLNHKLDNMIAKIGESNDIQNRILINASV